MLIIIGALLIVSGAACIIFDMGLKAAKPEKEKPKDEQPEE